MGIVGITIALIPFVLSLFPSDRAYAALPRYDISDLNHGSFKLVIPDRAFETFNGFKQSVFFLKTKAGEIRAWKVYTKNGEIGMPDYHWWRTYFTCRDFRPGIINGVIDENSYIQCHDKNISQWQSNNWRWNLDGKALTQNVTDMNQVKGFIEGDFYVIGKKR
jgi:hypothetical protein